MAIMLYFVNKVVADEMLCFVENTIMITKTKCSNAFGRIDCSHHCMHNTIVVLSNSLQQLLSLVVARV